MTRILSVLFPWLDDDELDREWWHRTPSRDIERRPDSASDWIRHARTILGDLARDEVRLIPRGALPRPISSYPPAPLADDVPLYNQLAAEWRDPWLSYADNIQSPKRRTTKRRRGVA